jgi:hypothetical protein
MPSRNPLDRVGFKRRAKPARKAAAITLKELELGDLMDITPESFAKVEVMFKDIFGAIAPWAQRNITVLRTYMRRMVE